MSPQASIERTDFNHFVTLQTRWMDNDVYGHVNNVNYYSYFDTAVNGYLIEHGVLDIHHGAVIGLVVETQCSYMQSVAFPDVLDAGLRVAHVGNSSVRYEIALFKTGEKRAAAFGHFVHVYVDRESRRPTRLDDVFRAVLQQLVVAA